MGTLLAKQRAPEIFQTLPRKGLALESAIRYKLVLIIAGPGYGKTTLAAQALSLSPHDQIWFRPSSEQKGIDPFLASMETGIASFYPGFSLPGEIKEGRDPAEKSALFLNQVESRMRKDLFVVVDDCHELNENPEVLVFLKIALDRICPKLHFILSGRSLPSIKLSRLMARQQVLRFSEADLAFSPSELGQIGLHCFSIALSGEQTQLIWEKTRGWVSGLILFFQSLNRQTSPGVGEALDLFKGSQRLVSDYYKENVFDILSRQEQYFLLKTSVLDEMETGFCSRFLGMEGAGGILRHLEDRHCFILAADEDRLCFHSHPLFKTFLQDRIPLELGAGQLARLHAGAARLYEKENQGQKALVHYVSAGQMEDASRLLNRFARPIIKQDRPHVLKSLLSVIPAHYMDDEPWFQYLQAGYYGVCSQLQLAVKGYEKVLKKFRSQKDGQGECLVLMELAEHYLSTGEIREAEQAYTRILVKNQLDTYLTIIVMGYLVRVLALQGRTSEADRYARKAMGLLGELDNQTDLTMGRAWIYVAQGYRWAFSGGYEKAKALGEEAKPLFESLGEYRFLSSAYFLISYACFYLGQFEHGKQAAQEGIQMASDRGLDDEFSEFLKLLKAKNSLELPRLTDSEIDQILEEVKNSLKSFQSGGFPGGVAQGCLVLHRAFLRKKETGRSEQCLRQGMAAVQGDDMPLIKNELHVALSSLLLFDRHPPQKREAFILLKDAEQELLYSGWHISWISRLFARYYWEYGHKETAYKYMVYSLKISEEEAFDPWIATETDWIVPILASMVGLGSMKSYILKLFRQMDQNIVPTLSSLQSGGKAPTRKAVPQILAVIPRPEPLPIRVFFFDRFRLFVGERQIRPDQWKSRKALTLCKYMLAMEEKGFLEREILMELLWPDEDPKKSAQRFHVAMASIRKTLEPDIFRGNRSSYIRRSGQAYRLSIGEQGRSDVIAFTAAVNAAKSETDPRIANTFCQKASSLYKGPFLREDPFDDWCETLREKYRQLYCSILMQMLSFYEAGREWELCIHTAAAYLEQDPFNEGVIQKLMVFHTNTGNRIMASQLYSRFKTAVRNELNCSVSNETTAIYNHLVSNA